MRINQNISAVLANDQLHRNENGLANSIERLSSGFKFNHAKDNPSGVAISYKMQAQINALNRASANTTDGLSMVQTADGAMGEMTEIVQRIRELCVQAANDTNGWDDRESIQQEIIELKKEVDRISTDTEFNGMTLMDGSMDRRVYSTSIDKTISYYDKITNIIVSDEVDAGDYVVDVASGLTASISRTSTALANKTSTVSASQEGVLKINGIAAKIKEGMTIEEAYTEIRDAAERSNVNVSYETDSTNGTLRFESKEAGSEQKIKLECDSSGLTMLLFQDTKVPGEAKGTDAKINNIKGFSDQATTSTKGNEVTITDRSGFSMSFKVPENTSIEANIEVTDIGTMQLQVGANENQEIAVSVPRLNSESLTIDKIDVTKVNGADRGIEYCDVAISRVTTARSKMGAYENRLEYAKKSLDETEENMTTAISRLEDTDMAEEMTTYSNQNVLNQAAISVLSQANDLPQQVLSLMQ